MMWLSLLLLYAVVMQLLLLGGSQTVPTIFPTATAGTPSTVPTPQPSTVPTIYEEEEEEVSADIRTTSSITLNENDVIAATNSTANIAIFQASVVSGNNTQKSPLDHFSSNLATLSRFDLGISI